MQVGLIKNRREVHGRNLVQNVVAKRRGAGVHLEVGGDGGKRYWDVWIGREVYVGVANVDIKNIYERPSQYLLDGAADPSITQRVCYVLQTYFEYN